MKSIYFIRIKKLDGSYEYYGSSYIDDPCFMDSMSCATVFEDYKDICSFITYIRESFERKDFSLLDHEQENYDLNSIDFVEFTEAKVHKF